MKRRFLLIVLVVLSFPISARGNELFAQFSRPRKPTQSGLRTWNGIPFIDMFGFSGTLWYAGFSGHVRVDKAGLIGTPVKLVPKFGFDEPEAVPVVGSYFQYEFKEGPVLRLEASYFWHRYEGDSVVGPGQEFTFEGWQVPAGTEIDSEMDVMMGKLNTRITPYRIDIGKADLRLSIYGGSMYARWIIRLKTSHADPGQAVGDNGQIKDELWATLGHIGPHVEVRFLGFRVYGWVSGLQFDRNEMHANYYEAGGGAQYEIFPFLVVGAEFFFWRARLTRDDQFRMDYSMLGPSFSLVLKY